MAPSGRTFTLPVTALLLRCISVTFLRYVSERNVESAAAVDREVNAEVELYVASPSVETKSLLAFPKIAAAFCRYNAALPNSAVAERLFSAAGQILTARRCKMSDENFDQSLFLRYILKE